MLVLVISDNLLYISLSSSFYNLPLEELNLLNDNFQLDLVLYNIYLKEC